jgi:hypothetical protein
VGINLCFLSKKMDYFNFVHSINIATHVIAGSIALLIGVVALMTKKGGKNHRKSGNIFLILLSIVIFTGLMGVFIFGRNSFLLVITVLSGYYGFSGYRVLLTKSNQPQWIDMGVAIGSLTTVFYFLYYFKTIGMIWAPIIIYSTVGTLISVVLYDFLRYFIPKQKYKTLWLYEHIYKMIGAFTALLAAFSGTVFKSYQPYSQIIPSVLGILLQVGFFVFYYRKNVKIREIDVVV